MPGAILPDGILRSGPHLVALRDNDALSGVNSAIRSALDQLRGLLERLEDPIRLLVVVDTSLHRLRQTSYPTRNTTMANARPRGVFALEHGRAHSSNAVSGKRNEIGFYLAS